MSAPVSSNPAGPTQSPPPGQYGRRGWVPLPVAALVAAVVLGGIIAARDSGSGSGTAPPASTGAAARSAAPQVPASSAGPVDQATLDRYWTDNFADASWYPAVTQVGWDGLALTAHTSLPATADSRSAAEAICTALSGYWPADGFRPVRVMDDGGLVLVSRRAQAEQCTWRR